MIKKGNLSASLLNWLMSTLQMGPGIGDVFHLCVSASEYHKWLANVQKVPGDHIFHTLALAYAATTNARNDVILVYPGTYTVTSELNWTNRYTHLVGVGGPNIRGYDTYGTQFYCATTDVARLVDLTGERCQFHNVTFANNYAAAGNVTAFAVRGYGAKLKGCQFIGMMATTQCSTAGNSSLEISAYGSYLEAENCIIGTAEWAAQSGSTLAPLYFSGVSSVTAPTDGKFTNCHIRSHITNATDSLIYVLGDGGLTGGWTFDRCEFYAFSANHLVACTQVIQGDAHPYTQDVLFKDCAAVNCTAYRTASSYSQAWATGAVGAIKSGIAIIATAS